MPGFDFIVEHEQPSLALSDDSYRYEWFESQYGGLEQYPETRSPEECFHPLNPHFDWLVERVNGLQFRERFTPLPAPKIEGYVPQIFPRNARSVPTAFLGSFAVQYRNLPRLVTGGFDPFKFMRVGPWPQDVVALATGNSKDPNLEKVWRASYNDRFWQSLRGLPNVVVVSPDFSVYTHYSDNVPWRQGRFEQVWNMKRSLDYFRRTAEAGLCGALTIAYATRRDLERWCFYLRNEGEAIGLLALNIQTQPHTASDQPRVIHAIEESVGRPFRWIVQGIGEQEGFRAFRDAGLLERTTFVSTSAQVLAYKRRDVYKRSYGGANAQRLLILNVHTKRQMLRDVMLGIERPPFEFDPEELQLDLPLGQDSVQLVLP